MVLFMIIIILTLVLASFQRAKKNVREDIKISDLQLLELSLEQYRAACKVYPESLGEDTDNGYAGETCGNTLSDFMPPKLSLELSDVYYQSYTSQQGSQICDQYHMGILLDKNTKYEDRDDDWDSSGVSRCGGRSIAPPNDPTKYFYDIHRPQSWEQLDLQF